MTTNADAFLEERMAVLRADVAASSDADTVAAATAATSSAEKARREAPLRGGGGGGCSSGDAGALLSELEIERDRVLRSAAKLEESNAELKAAIAAGEDDDGNELRAAFGENIVIIAKYRARAAALEEEVRKAKGVRAGSGASVAVEPQWLARPESGGGGGSATAAAAANAAAAQPHASDNAITAAAEGGGGDVWL